MTSTTKLERGDIVLVRFVFADEEGAKRRPVLILSTDEYNSARREVIVSALTSNVTRLLPGDRLIEGWRESGLPKPSVATGIVRTIKASMVESRLGRLPASDLRAVAASLRKAMGL